MSEKSVQQKYTRQPLRFHRDIPVFIETNDFIRNYEEIATDHLRSLDSTGLNPFIPEDDWREMEDTTIALIRKYSQPGARILDVGVGLGRLLSHLPDMERHGVDISLNYLERVADAGIDACCALIEDLPYESESFDVIVCTDVLEHVLDLNAACAEMLRILKPGGTLVARVPYREDLSSYLHPDTPYHFIHLRNFDESSLRLLFERIFNAKVCEFVMAGRTSPRSALGVAVPIPAGKAPLAVVLRGLRSVVGSVYRGLTPWRRRAIGINVVVQKLQ